MQFREEYRKDANAWYRTYEDGTVIAYGYDPSMPMADLWIASAWSAHPLDDPQAEHLGYLCSAAFRSERDEALLSWENPATRKPL
jgi:hypothetical protein